LEEEGLMQVFYVGRNRREPIIGVVGALQFDVITSRLRTEYGVAVAIEPAPYAAARWPIDSAQPTPAPGGAGATALDHLGRRVLLFESGWALAYFERHHPDLKLQAEATIETDYQRDAPHS
jgi:peptide chain release factor 3